MPSSGSVNSPKPVVAAAVGALFVAWSGILVRLAETTPVTVAIYRCAYALPVLAVITRFETRRHGSLPSRSRNLALIAGVFFAADLIFWHNAIEAVGAGLATVLGNLQVLIVGFAAWLFLSEKPQRSLFAAIPLVVAGVVLISGVTGDAYGASPVLGVIFGVATSIAYAAFILVLREGSGDLRRIAGPLFYATLMATGTATLYAVIFGGVEWNPGWPAQGWLGTLAMTSQVMGWLFISRSLPRLPAAITSVILLLQPVGAMILAAVILDERPSLAQIGGAVLILVGVVVAIAGHQRRLEPEGALV